MTQLAQTLVNRPLCPPLIHDDSTRIAVSLIGTVVCLYVMYRVMRHFGGF